MYVFVGRCYTVTKSTVAVFKRFVEKSLLYIKHTHIYINIQINMHVRAASSNIKVHISL